VTDTITQDPLAFQAHLTGAVIPTADRCAKFAVRTALEVTEDVFTKLAVLAREKTPVYAVFVPDAESAQDVVIPPRPATEPKAKKQQSPSSKHRFALETLAGELDTDPKAFYEAEMQKSTSKVWERIEDLRREKAYMREGG
jgi:hypothetical protein